MRLLPGFLLALALSGCTPLVLCLHATTDANDGRWFETAPAGPKEHRLVVEPVPLAAEPRPPPAPEPAPEPRPPAPATTVLVSTPGPVTVVAEAAPPAATPAPEQLVGPPWGTAPLYFDCHAEERFSLEHVTEHYEVYGTIEKLMLGMFALFDLGVTAGSYQQWKRPDAAQQRTGLVLGTVAAADFLGLVGLIAFKDAEIRLETWDAPGPWQTSGQGCPAGLETRAGVEGGPVDAHGQLDPATEARVVKVLATTGSPLELTFRGGTQPFQLDPWVRCELAKGRRFPASPRCAGLRPGFTPPLAFPLAP